MKKQNGKNSGKTRNWLAVHAFLRSGSGLHKSKKTYTRKTKHKGKRRGY